MLPQNFIVFGPYPPLYNELFAQLKPFCNLFFMAKPMDKTVSRSFKEKTAVLYFYRSKEESLLEEIGRHHEKFRTHCIFLLNVPPSKAPFTVKALKTGVKEIIFEGCSVEEIVDNLDKNIPAEPMPRGVSGSTLLQAGKSFFKEWNKKSSKEPLSPTLPDTPAASPLSPQAYLNIQFMGNFELSFQGKSLKLQGSKAKSILAFLLYHRHSPFKRELIIDKFWPEKPTSEGRNCLNVHMHSIRKALSKLDKNIDWLQLKEDSYYFHPDLIIQSDVEQFNQYWEYGQSADRLNQKKEAQNHLQKAATAYRGDFMEDSLYEEWTETIRERLKETYLAILEKLSESALKDKQYQTTIHLSRVILDKDPCLETAYFRLIQCYRQLGKRHQAIKAYQKCKSVLRKELGISPSVRMQALYGEVLEG